MSCWKFWLWNPRFACQGNYGPQSGYNEKGEYEYRRPEDRFQYTYKAAGGYASERAFRDQKSAHQRTKEWSKVYEDLNNQRHQEYYQAAKAGKADYSDFLNGSRGDRNYEKFQRFYKEHPNEFMTDSQNATNSKEFFESGKYSTNERYEEEKLRDRSMFETAANRHRGMIAIDYFIRGTVYLGFGFFLYKIVEYTKKQQQDEQDFDLLAMQEEMRRNAVNRSVSEYQHAPRVVVYDGNTSAAAKVQNERRRIYLERMKMKEEMMKRDEEKRRKENDDWRKIEFENW